MKPLNDFSPELPQDVYDKLIASFQQMDAALISKDPQMKEHLRNIHATQIQYPGSLVLLEDKDIARQIEAYKTHAGIEIVKATAKGQVKSSRKQVSIDDI